MGKGKYAKEFQKQRRRINRFLREAGHRGYVFPEAVFVKNLTRPNKASVERLKKIKPEDLYKKAWYFGEGAPEAGVRGLEGRKIERKAAAQKSRMTKERAKAVKEAMKEYDFYKTIISNKISEIKAIPEIKDTEQAKSCREMLISWIKSAVVQNGYQAVAAAMQQSEARGAGITYYNVNYFEACLDFIRGVNDNLEGLGFDTVHYKSKLDFIADLAEKAEYIEDWDGVW